MRIAAVLLIFFLSFQSFAQVFKVGVAGLSHDHVHWIMNRNTENDLEIIGIAERNLNLRKRYSDQYNLPDSLFYDTVEEMLEKTNPEAVCAFNAISKHVEVIRSCAKYGVDVMVEKPLTFSNEEALEIKNLVEETGINVLTNYETTWYPSNHLTYELIHEQKKIGQVRKVVVHDGHKGPIEIGCSKEFTDWLTDPAYNGAGALVDFGCYGANLITWINKGQRPTSVTAITQQIKPDIYPKVDDEATIILTYEKSQCIIQASWNWPFNRKDLQVYGTNGYIYAENSELIKLKSRQQNEEQINADDRIQVKYSDPFIQLRDVVRGEFSLPPFHPSSLENNLIVVEILSEAIKQSKY